MQLVKLRRFQNRVAMGGDIAIALIIRQNEDDVGTLARQRIVGRIAAGDENQ